MQRYPLQQRLKWAAAILCVLLSPIVGMVVSVCVFWRGSLTGGIAVGGVVGTVLYFGILWRELKLKEHWLKLVLSVPVTLLLAYLLLCVHTMEMAVLALGYTPAIFTLLLLLGPGTAPAVQKPSTISARIGVVALTLLAIAVFCAGQISPILRPMADTFIWLYAAAVLFGAIAFFGRIFFERTSNSSLQKANRAYRQECDPHPMLEECERRLSKRLSKTARHRWLMQKAAALADLGETESATKIVNALLASEQELSVQTRWACLYDLADFHCGLGNPEAAADYRTKAYACARQCKSLKTKQMMLDVLHAQEGVQLYHTGEYESAKRHMLEYGWDSEDATQTLCTRVFHTYWVGMVLLKTGDTEQAMEKLRFVAEHGNRLFVASKSSEMIN